MLKNAFKNIMIFTFCAAAAMVMPMEAQAAQENLEYQTSTSTIIRVEDEMAQIYAEPDAESEMIGQAVCGDTYEILEMNQDQWVKVLVGEVEGYLDTSSAATTMAETVIETVVDKSMERRMQIVEFGKQFIGRPYVWGGMSPAGFDCSGFTSYVMKHAAGVHLSHSSRAQANEGHRISIEEMRPGDLICYGKGKSINHVAMYIGDGQVVHASTERTGVKISPWNYRAHVAIVNVLGD